MEKQNTKISLKPTLKVLLLIFVCYLASTAIAQSKLVVIKDANFEKELIRLDIDKDGFNGVYLTDSADKVVTLSLLSGKGITNLSGIEAFKNLKILKCDSNNIVTISICFKSQT